MNGKPHGRGTLILPNGQISTGMWEFGENVSIDRIDHH